VSTDAGATLTAVIGLLLVRLAVQGTYRSYVRPGMGPWIAVAGVLLTLLGIIVLWRHRRGEDDHSDHEHGGEQVAWLLLAPVLALLLIAPGALGSFSLGRTGSAVTVRSGHGVFARLDPEAGSHEMSLLEFNQRAFEGTRGASFNGATVRIIGFVGPTKADGFVVARYSIACCAADALAATALVTGWTGRVPARDSWVEVEGRFEPGGEVDPRLVAASVTVIPTPNDPYE
jgi:uncharacterized repeat protein (TIGR03943 family)